MTIKEATMTMLRNIEIYNTIQAGYKPTYNKEIAKRLEITQATYSRLRTGVVTPRIATWFKICKLHTETNGENKTKEITEQCA